MRLKELSSNDYSLRIKRLQAELKKNNIDLFIGYSSECESATTRYLTGFWPFFDFAAVLIPVEGRAALITGGPESFDFAKSFSKAVEIYINPLLVETSAPEWVPAINSKSFAEIIKSVCNITPKRIGMGNYNIFPYILINDLKNAVPDSEFIPADNMLLSIQAIKEDSEIPYIVNAFKIAEESLKEALSKAEPDKKEWEIESYARAKMALLGAEGMPYPSWVCSGKNTMLSLCRSRDIAIGKNNLVQLTIGTKYMGYCGNICRPFAIGKFPEPAKKLADVALEAFNYVLETIKPGVNSSDLFKGYFNILSKYGYENYTLYGPAHGTGSSEVEGLWISKDSNFIIKPNMVFNIDIWLSENDYGLRYEDGILIAESGIKELTNYKREIITL